MSSNITPPQPLNLDECTDHVYKVLTAHGQALTNLMNDEQLVIAKTNMQEENESAAETSRRLNQTASRKLVSTKLHMLPDWICLYWCLCEYLYVCMYNMSHAAEITLQDELVSNGVVSEDTRQEIMQEQQVTQRAIAMNTEDRKQRMVRKLRERAAQRKEARMNQLKDKHLIEKNSLLQELDKQMAEGDLTLVTKSKKVMELEERHEKELEGIAKQIDSSCAQQEQKLNEALNQQQIEEIKESHKEAMKKLLSTSGLDPSQQDAVMQEFVEGMDRIVDEVKDQKDHRIGETKVLQLIHPCIIALLIRTLSTYMALIFQVVINK